MGGGVCCFDNRIAKMGVVSPYFIKYGLNNCQAQPKPKLNLAGLSLALFFISPTAGRPAVHRTSRLKSYNLTSILPRQLKFGVEATMPNETKPNHTKLSLQYQTKLTILNQTKPTIPYQTKPTKPSLPYLTYQTKPIKRNLS